jgi:uncharacterized protein (TIGR03067 family)
MLPMICLLSTFTLGADTAEAAAKKDQAKLEGTWRLVGGEEVGHVLSPEDAKKEEEQCVIKGDKLTILHRGKVKGEVKFTLDPSKNPREMDLHFIEANKKGKKCLAIYALEGDKLTLCMETKMRPSRGGPRPNVFSTKKTTEKGKHPGLLMFVLERQK